ncbi:hypothetical protein G4B88_024120 [Cannabis sativa]|uniref:Uncharacterized protein n=1 Tax=Cannabis sativa TaxID=3483 RepID=A0A7J6H5S8_CANSA|nr:hypothetical protein G4B88_024120 [Cannabis sativa]
MILSDDSRSWETIHKSHLLSSQILTAAPHHELGRRFTSLSASPACLPPPAASLLFFVVDVNNGKKNQQQIGDAKCSCCCGTGARLGIYVACLEVLSCVPSKCLVLIQEKCVVCSSNYQVDQMDSAKKRIKK